MSLTKELHDSPFCRFVHVRLANKEGMDTLVCFSRGSQINLNNHEGM